MATTIPNVNIIGSIGTPPDAVSLQLGGDDILIAESWDCHESVLDQPSCWSIRCGWGGTANEFLTQYPKGTPFQLMVGGVLQQTGRLDGRRATNQGGATEITLKGRDMLARVYDAHVDAVQRFTDSTYESLVWRVLLYLGLVNGTDPDPAQLATTNQANRQIKAGKPVVQNAPPRTPDQILTDDSGAPVVPGVHQELQANVGERWLSFLHRYLDPAGLILWAAADGTFVLSAPNPSQQPLYQITRQAYTNTTQLGNVISYDFVDDATHRHSDAVCYGRGGGRKTGRSKAKGTIDDVDLQTGNAGWYERGSQPLSFRESNVQNTEQAENWAQRKLAEERRAGWRLEYTIAGHTLPMLGGNGSAVVTVDTLVSVNDEELGINAVLYVERVQRCRGPQTTTTIGLCRTTDLLLGPDPPGHATIPEVVIVGQPVQASAP